MNRHPDYAPWVAIWGQDAADTENRAWLARNRRATYPDAPDWKSEPATTLDPEAHERAKAALRGFLKRGGAREARLRELVAGSQFMQMADVDRALETLRRSHKAVRYQRLYGGLVEHKTVSAYADCALLHHSFMHPTPPAPKPLTRIPPNAYADAAGTPRNPAAKPLHRPAPHARTAPVTSPTPRPVTRPEARKQPWRGTPAHPSDLLPTHTRPVVLDYALRNLETP
jgi:hypothetical protein